MLAIAVTCTKSGLGANLFTNGRKRVIVLTDFYKDPDDKQSMVRFLTYANEFDIEGHCGYWKLPLMNLTKKNLLT